MENNICVEMVNFTPTMRCNLKCKLCGVLVPHYSYCPQMTVDEFEKSLEAMFQVVDYVRKLQITGGEPFMHPQLPELIKKCFQYEKQFDKVWILTNGTIPLKPELLEAISQHKDRILVHISDYGLKKENTEKLVRELQEIGCEYRYLKYYGEQQYFDGWVDQGDFVSHGREKKELRQIFKECPHVCRGGSWYIRNGQVHWCGRAIRGMELQKIPLKDTEYLDLFEGTREEKREKFVKLMQLEFITACDYCNGNYGTSQLGKRYPAGEQIE